MGKSNIEQLAIAKKYLGQGGSRFRKFCGLPSGSAWCDAYVTTIFHEAGNKDLFCGGTKQTYCPTTIKWCYNNLASIPPYLALPSDIIFFDWELNGIPNHIGFVRERKSCDEIYTIEGNTGNSICANRTRNTKYVQAVFRPHFKASYKIGTLEVDGLMGYNTIAMLQTALKAKGTYSGAVDGILGKGTVKGIQKLCGVTADGIWGKGTSKAVQKNLCGVTSDGLFGVNSVKALQRWINVVTKSTPSTEVKYSGTIPSIHVTKSVSQVINDSIKWGKWIASDNSFHYGYGKDAHHNGCYFCGTQPASKRKSGIKDWEKTYCCNPFIHACFAHGGLITAMLSLCEKGKSYGFAKSEGYAKSAYFKAMGKLSASKLVAGDVLCSDSHVALYIGSGKVVQASGGDNNVPYSTSWNKSISVGAWNGYTRVYRLIKGVNADVAIRFGEYSDRVKQLQQFLNWYNGKTVCTVDGIFGESTLKYVKAFQTAQKIAVDGIVGNGTLSKMKVAQVHPQQTTPQTKVIACAQKLITQGFKYVKYNKNNLRPTNGGNCIRFVGKSYRDAGINVSDSASGLLNNAFADKMLKASASEALAMWKKRNGSNWEIIKDAKGVSESRMKPSDIIIGYKGNSYIHTALKGESGYIYDCCSDQGGAKKRKFSRLGCTPKIIFRYTGK